MHHQTNVWSTPKNIPNFCTNTMLWPPFFHSNKPIGFPNRGINSCSVKGPDWPQIYNLQETYKLETATETTSYLNIKIYGNLEKRGNEYESHFTSALMPSLAKTSAACDQITRWKCNFNTISIFLYYIISVKELMQLIVFQEIFTFKANPTIFEKVTIVISVPSRSICCRN